jgi:hypothetical protein
MAIAPNNLHDSHEVEIEKPARYRRGPRQGEICTAHAAALICRTCNQHLQWLSREDLATLQEIHNG